MTAQRIIGGRYNVLQILGKGGMGDVYLAEDIKLPRGADIAAIVRGDQVLMAHHDTVIQADDHVILFITERKRALKKVEQLFQVSVGYL